MSSSLVVLSHLKGFLFMYMVKKLSLIMSHCCRLQRKERENKGEATFSDGYDPQKLHI